MFVQKCFEKMEPKYPERRAKPCPFLKNMPPNSTFAAFLVICDEILAKSLKIKEVFENV